MKVLVAVDGSSYGDAVVDSICSRPWPDGTEFRVVTVIETVHPPLSMVELPPDLYDEEYDKQIEQLRHALSEAVARIRDAGGGEVSVTGEMMKGSPKNSILDEAERWDADWIVLGSHGYGNIARFFLGSVSQSVASHAKCSVEIVRKKGVHAI